MKPAFLIAITTALFLSAAAIEAHQEDAKSNTTVIVVRHAEKASSDRDPVLSEAGRARAGDLAHVLGQTPVDAIFTTQYIRTRETARPLSERRKLEAIVIDATDTHIKELAERIRTKHRNQTVVVVGHSNTVPAILAALGANNPPAIGDDEYDHLFVLNIREDNSAHLVSLRYGASK